MVINQKTPLYTWALLHVSIASETFCLNRRFHSLVNPVRHPPHAIQKQLNHRPIVDYLEYDRAKIRFVSNDILL
jgi:hypothetical protein